MNNDKSMNNRAEKASDQDKVRKVGINSERQSVASRQQRAPPLTMTLYCPVRLGGSHSSWLSDTVTEQGVSPINTV